MAVYNGSRYLKQQLDSFLKQSKQPDELIVSDDGSTDETMSILNEFKQQAPFNITILQNQTSLGVTGNFNRALENCSGDYIFLSDQDDVWLEEKIDTVAQFFDNNSNIHLILHDILFCDASLNSSGQTKFGRSGKSYYKAETGMATAIRCDLLNYCLPIPSGVCHDSWLHQCAEFIGGRDFIFDVLVYFRRHDKNTSKNELIKSGLKVNCFSLILERVRKNDVETVRLVTKKKINMKKKLLAWSLQQKPMLINSGLCSEQQCLIQEKKIQKILSDLFSRLQLLAEPKYIRIFFIVRLYFKGGYKNFNGIKSALKDFVIY